MKAISMILKAVSVATLLADVHDALALVSAHEETDTYCDGGWAARTLCLDTTIEPRRRCPVKISALTDSACRILFPEARHSLLMPEYRRGTSTAGLQLAGVSGTDGPSLRVSGGSVSVGPGQESFAFIRISVGWSF